MPTFTESQRFRQWWLWLIMSMVVVITVTSLFINDSWRKPFEILGLVVLALILLLFYYWRLDTRLDAEGIHYRVFPVFAWRTIPWDTIQSITVNSFGFIGYGIRLGVDGWVYNVSGNKGMRIVRKNKSILTIGTQQPDELQAFLAKSSVLSGI